MTVLDTTSLPEISNRSVIIFSIRYSITVIPIEQRSIIAHLHSFAEVQLIFQRDQIMSELEENLRQAIQMKLIARGVNPASLSDIDLDQYSSDEDSR